YQKTGQPIQVKTFTKKEKNEFLDHYWKHAPAVSDEFVNYVNATPGSIIVDAFLEEITVSMVKWNTEPYTDEELEIYERFAKEFRQTYIRFLDIKKAEAQARESEIQLALERVRARTMAMKKSDELREAVRVIYEQLEQLHFEATACNIIIMDKESGSMQYWVSGFTQDIYPESYHVPFLNHPYLNAQIEPWKQGEKYAVMEYSGEEKKRFDEIFFSKTGFKNVPEQAKLAMKSLKMAKLSTAYCRYGALQVFGLEPLSEKKGEILRRFAKVFDQTYSRFLDLQKAEAQAKEAQIEAALERVRSRTMGMQKAEELGEVATVLFKEMNALVDNLWTCGFVLCEPNRQEDEWWLSLNNGLIQPFFLPNIGDFAHESLYEGWKKGESYRTVTLQDEVLQEHYDWLMNIPISRKIFEEMEGSGIPRPNWQRLHAAYFKTGYLVIITEVPCEEEEIFKRFAQVFDLTYTRFLDLKKAEAQAREAQIEAALERVRSRTMAMHSSQDVDMIVTTLFDELLKLGVDKWIRSGIGIMDKSRRMEVWTASTNPSGQTALDKGFLDMESHQLLKEVQEAWETKKTTNSYELVDDDLINYFKTINDAPEYSFQVDFEKLPNKIIHYDFFFPEGALFAFSPTPLSDEISRVFMRFASVFGQTYRRYLDLQKAEAQAREALIEVALERVRSRTMAMHNSNDVSEATVTMFTELEKLGIENNRGGIAIIREDQTMEVWSVSNIEAGKIVKGVGILECNAHPLWVQMFHTWKNKQDYMHSYLAGKSKEEYLEIINNIPNYLSQPLKELPDMNFQAYVFKEGTIWSYSLHPHSEEDRQILKRFASAYSLTFRRYMDLQKAEAQALEAIKRASVDRVRAEIASMRTKQDLERITPLIWKELTTLGIPFVRCGVFIMDEQEELIHTFLSTPDGKAIAAFHLPYDSPGRTSEILAHWIHKQVYIEHWDETAFSELGDLLLKQGALPSKDVYLKTVPQGGIYLHCLPFMQGMLYVGNSLKLKEEDIQLIQSVADAFSTAYARYEDFNKLEAAKQQVDKTLVDLKQTQQQLIQSEKLASLGQLTAGIAHEIKNPLNFVNNFSEVSMEMIEEVLEARSERRETRSQRQESKSYPENQEDKIQKGERDESEEMEVEILEDIKANLKKIHEHGSRANGIVTSMLQHSRGGSGKMEPTDLNALIKEYVNLSFHGMRAGKNPINVDIQLDLDPDLGMVSLIKEDFTRVIINLCNNAFDAMREKVLKTEDGRQKTEDGEYDIIKYDPKLKVTTNLENGQVRISLEDNGLGIPDEIKDKILQPFFTTKKGTEGTGLGLSITHDIVKAHGGELEIASQPGSTVFFIRLNNK
ncbi:sensor histidine kinase, partial [Aquiflexum sp.]|uniref:sensor histidine kinase n=1 Tax=Aquiflexum sp. TaxID=1872584 RepID=UPI003593BA99